MSLRASFAVSLALIPLTLAGGCYADEADDPGRHEFRTTGCTVCGLGGNNSPTVNGFAVPELHLDGQLNDDLVKLEGIRSPLNVWHPLHVIDEEFAVVLPGQTLSGADLVGWTIVLRTPGVEHEVEISAYDHYASLAYDAPAISVYGLQYESTIDVGELVSVCPGATPGEAVVTLIRDETYDGEAMLVEPDRLAWFTLACADHAVAKMKRMNYGPNADFNGTSSPATVDQRQATLRMITADYCGKGHSFTEQGTKVFWDDVAGTVNTLPLTTANREAYWSADGALCLDRPRLVEREDVDAECRLPGCDEIDVDDPAIVWVTQVP